jgi:hypothetical protein
MPIDDLTPLEDFEPGSRVRIDRILEDLELNRDTLRYLEDHKLLPGAELEVSEKDPEGAVTVLRNGESVAVGRTLASHVLCIPA